MTKAQRSILLEYLKRGAVALGGNPEDGVSKSLKAKIKDLTVAEADKEIHRLTAAIPAMEERKRRQQEGRI